MAKLIVKPRTRRLPRSEAWPRFDWPLMRGEAVTRVMPARATASPTISCFSSFSLSRSTPPRVVNNGLALVMNEAWMAVVSRRPLKSMRRPRAWMVSIPKMVKRVLVLGLCLTRRKISMGRERGAAIK